MKTKTRTKLHLLAAYAGALAMVAGYDFATAEKRFDAAMQSELWNLRQATGDAAPLDSAKRAELHARLASPEGFHRWPAAAELASWRDTRSLPILIATMQDDAGTQRTCLIAQAIGKVGDPAAIPALCQAMMHPSNRDLRLCATHALAEIGDVSAVQPLIEKAIRRDLPRDDYLAAIRALGDLGSPEALPTLQRLAASDSDEAVRQWATNAIAQIEMLRSANAVAELTGALLGNERWVEHRWILRQLERRWDQRVADPLAAYIGRGGALPSENLVQATALLIHHRTLTPRSIELLSQSTDRRWRWMQKFVTGPPPPALAFAR